MAAAGALLRKNRAIALVAVRSDGQKHLVFIHQRRGGARIGLTPIHGIQ